MRNLRIDLLVCNTGTINDHIRRMLFTNGEHRIRIGQGLPAHRFRSGEVGGSARSQAILSAPSEGPVISTPTTLLSEANRLHKALPIKPLAPVTRTFIPYFP